MSYLLLEIRKSSLLVSENPTYKEMIENLDGGGISVEIHCKTFIRKRKTFQGDIGIRHSGGE
jgi:hypothetical protein